MAERKKRKKQKMKKKIVCCSSAVLIGMALLTGCQNAIPEMNEEERNMVVNYAADMVQKYDRNHPAKLQMLTLSQEEENAREAAEEEAAKEQTAKGQEETDADDTSEQTEVIDNTQEDAEATLDEAIMYQGFHFSYEGYETRETYPAEGTELYFTMNATEGNELLILKFLADNQSESEEMLNLLDTGIRFKIQVNGETKNALTTMLLNDFANYKDVVAGGESVNLVAICEIPKEQMDDIASLALIVKNEDETATISLH